jgi:hypothetical protein
VELVIERAARGLRVRHRCVAPTRRNRKRHRRARRCTRYVRVGALTRSAPAGRVRTPFSGRIGRRPLRRGKHRVTIRATDPAGNRSRPATATFVIVPR